MSSSTKKKQTVILVISIAILAILVFFEPMFGWRLRSMVMPAAPGASGQADASDTAAENEALKAQLAQLQNIEAQIPAEPANYLRAMVYSRYPFNFKNELLVNAGSGEGVAQGKAVVFQDILVGSIEKIFPDTAIVQTVFDPNFKMPVRVGASGSDGLLVGGADPKVTSIAKGAAVQGGDIVYAAAPGFPYGLAVAEVEATSTSADNLFQEASLNFVYDLNNVQTVLIQQ